MHVYSFGSAYANIAQIMYKCMNERESELKRENNCRIIDRDRSTQLDVKHTFGFKESLFVCGGGLYLGCNASFRQKG